MVINERSLSNNIVTQSNKLTEARYTLTVSEQRLVLTILSFISPDDKDFQEYSITTVDLKKMLGIEHHGVKKRLSDTIEKLAKRSLKLKNDNGFLITNWFSSAEYLANQGVVNFCIDPKLRPHLLQLKKQFTKLNLQTVAYFRSAYTIRVYMLLKQYETIGYREFTIEEFRDLLGVDDDKYKEFKDFNKRVISKAKKDFDAKVNDEFVSDISFTLETIKSGRKISKLRFNIVKNKKSKLIIPVDDSTSDDQPETIERLIAFGIRSDKASDWIHTYGIEYLDDKMLLTSFNKDSGKITGSVSGFLVSAVEQDFDTGEVTKAKEEKLAAEKEEQKNKEKLFKIYVNCWLDKAKLYIKNKVIDQHIDEMPTDELDILKESIRADLRQVNMYVSDDSTAFTGTLRLKIGEQISDPVMDQIVKIRKEVEAPNLDEIERFYDVNTANKIQPFLEDFKKG